MGKPPWGEWVALRSRVVGFRSQRELANAVGCRPEQISRWAQMVRPPRQMRKGFDEKLAMALQTTRHTLFVEFWAVPAEKAARVVGGALDVYPGSLSISPAMTDKALVEEVLRRLTPSEMEKVLEYAILIVRAKADGRSAEFDRYFKAHAASRPLTIKTET